MLDKLIEFCLRQRFLVIIATAIIIGVGYVSWQNLNLDAVPDITTNQVVVNTGTGGLSPEEVERLVTFPIETSMAGLQGVEQVRSLSQYGLSQVTVTFSDSVETYLARQLVNERLNSVLGDLPDGIEAPEMGPVSTGLGEIYLYSLESDERSPMELRTIQDWQIAPQLRTVAGVAEVSAADGSEKQYQVVVDPTALLARRLSIDEVVEALQDNNQNAGGGVLERNGERVLIRSVGMATTISDIEHIVIKTDNGVPVLVRDVAEVRLGIPVLTGVSTKDGKRALVVTVMMLKGANGLKIADEVDKQIEEIREQLPPDVKLETLYNRSTLVNATINTVGKNLLEGGLLVVLVIILLLGNFRCSLIAAAVIPISMLGAVFLMNRYNVSGNLMSLGALDFGLIIDGAVVMVENAVRRVAQAREKTGRKLTRSEVRHSVFESAREVAKPTLAAVTIITVVYLPILALEGTEGKMFRPMAFTVVFALLVALALAMTLVPVLSSLVLSGNTKEIRNPLMIFLTKLYKPSLAFALKRRTFVVTTSLLLVVVSGFMFTRLGSEFIPQLDEGSLVVQPVRARTVDEATTVRLVTAMEKKILEVPEVTTVFSRSGTPEVATDPMPLSLSDSFVMLKPQSEWRKGLTKEQLLEEIEAKTAQVPGQGYSFTQPIQMRFSELVSGVKADVGIKIFGDDLKTLKEKADEIADLIRGIPGAEDVEIEQVDEVPVLQIDIDRAAVARLGITIASIQELIAVALGGEPVGQIIEGDRRFALTVRFPDRIRNDVQAIRDLLIEIPGGTGVPLSSVAHIDTVTAPAQISREDGGRRVVVQLNVRNRDLGSFVAEAQEKISAGVDLPEGYYVTWGGQFENLERASTRLLFVVPVALALIFVILFTTFGSVKQSLLIFTGVPLAITGGIVALAVRDLPFSISAGVGFIALSGVAVLNGVVMVSAINRLRKESSLSVADAVKQGALLRLRPVLMTALVAALGFIPMAINTGLGAEVQRPLATVVIGGIVSSTLLTLLVLPALYTLFERDGEVAEDI